MMIFFFSLQDNDVFIQLIGIFSKFNLTPAAWHMVQHCLVLLSASNQ